MPAAVAQRLLGLAAVALLGGVIALAVIERRSDDASATPAPTGAVAPGGGWYSALAASRGPAGDAERTTCGLILTDKSLGVTHPVLPCGAKLLLRFGGQTVLTEVIDNKLKSAGRQFELTERLARRARPRRHAGDRLAVRRAGRGLAAPSTRPPRSTRIRRARPCAWPGVST